jgi:glucan-binding YG repeat protein
MLDVQFECGTFDKASDLDEILSYYAKGTAYSYTTGIETAGDVFHKLLRTATCHEKAHWVTTAAGKKYMLIDGTYVRNKWFTLDGKTYRFDKNGIMLKGWFTLNGKRYYLNSRGERITGKRTVNGHMYLFDEDGVARKRLT